MPRRFQFSLRALLVVVATVAIGLAAGTHYYKASQIARASSDLMELKYFQAVARGDVGGSVW
ncbi:MAG: hypothetical protein ACREHD_05515, partial [Pirellulales bacterium]